jgi:hypothetical protein
VLKASTRSAIKPSSPDAVSNRNSGGDQASWDKRPDCVVTPFDGAEEVIDSPPDFRVKGENSPVSAWIARSPFGNAHFG